MSNENLALYWLAALVIAALFASESTAWVSLLIIMGSLVLELTNEVALWIWSKQGKRKRKYKQ